MINKRCRQNQGFVKKISMNIFVQVMQKIITKMEEIQKTLFIWRTQYRKHVITTINHYSEYILYRIKFFLHQTRKKIPLLFLETVKCNYLARYKIN